MPTKPVETVAIVDLGNDIQLTYSVSGFIYTFNKLSLKIKNTGTECWISNSVGFHMNQDNHVLKLNYAMVSSPTYASNAALYAGLVGMVSSVSLGGGGGVGGGNNTWSNAQGDFVATVTASTQNITITGLPWTLEDIHVVAGQIKKIDSSGDVETLRLSNVTVSGGVITLGDEDNFASGDSVLVTLVGPDKAYDEAGDQALNFVTNQDSEKWTSPEHLIDLSAQGAITSRYVIPMEGFKDLSMHWKISNSDAGDTITLTLWATNNADADDTADTDWVDVTADFLSKTLTVNNGTVEQYEQIANIHPLKLMVKVVTASAGATNAIDLYIKKKAL